MDRYPKIVDTPHYHIWTDALHARALAYQAANKWDRGTYIRWTITTAWTVLETSCEDALDTTGIGRRFKDNLNAAIANRGTGVWQQLSLIHKLRKDFIHVNPSQDALFPNANEAGKAIKVVREAIKDIYNRTGKDAPSWVEDDYDQGWDKEQGSIGHGLLIHSGADANAADTIRVGYVYKDREYISDILPAGSAPEPVVEQLLRNTRIPISRVRVYKGKELIVDRELSMQGT